MAVERDTDVCQKKFFGVVVDLSDMADQKVQKSENIPGLGSNVPPYRTPLRRLKILKKVQLARLFTQMAIKDFRPLRRKISDFSRLQSVRCVEV